MAGRRRWLAGAVAVVLIPPWVSVSVVCAVPTALDAAVVTVQGEAVLVPLGGRDADIDPQDPDSHRLSITVLIGPANGALSGDESAVRYIPPDIALVEFLYTPEESFTGTDFIVFEVADPTGNTDVAQIRVDVEPPPRAYPSISGSWSSSFTYDNTAASPLTDTVTRGNLVVDWDGLTFDAAVGFRDLAFVELALNAAATFEDLGSIQATIRFDPTSSAFSYLSAATTFGLGDVNLQHVFFLTVPAENSYSELRMIGQIGPASVSNALTFSGCTLGFMSNVTRVSWRSVDCDAQFTATLKIGCEEGFECFQLRMSGYSLDPFLGLPLELDLGLTFEPQEKSMELGLACSDVYVDCIRLYCEAVDEDPDPLANKNHVELYGIEVQCSIGTYVRFRGATSLSEDKNAAVTGRSDYFEVYTLSGTFLSCCDLSSSWQVNAFFKENAASLFDVSLIEISVDLAIARPFGMCLDLSHDVTSGQTLLVTGFSIAW